MGWLDFLVMALGAHRAWVVWFQPGGIMTPVRNFLMRRGGLIGYLASCPLCVSVWMGAGTYGAWLTGSVGQFPVVALALSGALMTVNTLNQVLERNVKS